MYEYKHKAPFPYFGGKSYIASLVWSKFGQVKQYIEPFCGSAAILLASPYPASLEVINDMNGFIANFWRAVKYQPANVVYEADYPISYIDLNARHHWLMNQCMYLREKLQDPEWPGDAKIAGWWLWGQCAWIGTGWCDWSKKKISFETQTDGKIPHITSAGMGIHAVGKIPHDSSGNVLLTSSGYTAWYWLHYLTKRLERVRILCGDWHRCLNHNYGDINTAIFLDPPYRNYETVYTNLKQKSIVDDVVEWALNHSELRIALCGLVGDYILDNWTIVKWTRSGFTYGGSNTTQKEAIWFSPACLTEDTKKQLSLFDDGE